MIKYLLPLAFLSSSAFAKMPSNFDFCYCSYLTLHQSNTPEEKAASEKEIREIYNKSYEEQIADQCKDFTETQDFMKTAGMIDVLTEGKVVKCLKERQK